MHRREMKSLVQPTFHHFSDVVLTRNVYTYCPKGETSAACYNLSKLSTWRYHDTLRESLERIAVLT